MIRIFLILLLATAACKPRSGAAPAAPAQPAAFTPEKLTTCVRTDISGDEPVYLDRLAEGDVAYYGLILQARGDAAIADYLLANSVDGLWEYQKGYGHTAPDSTLVIEGLLEHGIAPERLAPSAEALVKYYWREEASSFRTVAVGRAAYWSRPAVETTAHAAYLLKRIAPERYGEQIEMSARFVRAQQGEDGRWSGRWFPSHAVPTFYAARFLDTFGNEYRREIASAAAGLLKKQSAAGDWEGSVIETAAAVRTLALVGEYPEAVARGRAWIKERIKNGAPGEPVLYYWFEDGGSRILYSCQDHGAVTGAWAALALR